MELPDKLKYTESHEWIADNGDGTVTVGITAVATEQLGELDGLLTRDAYAKSAGL